MIGRTLCVRGERAPIGRTLNVSAEDILRANGGRRRKNIRMKILILNGSPKGKNSITLQTALYLEKRHPEHAFKVLHIGQMTKTLERDFSLAREELKEAELILFAYPVYTFLAPYQVHRFIEFLKEDGVDLRGKYVSQLTTSKHFYDVTAHRYIEENCRDLGMRFIRGLSADMAVSYTHLRF